MRFLLSMVGLGGYAKDYLGSIRRLGRDVCGLRSVYVRGREKYAEAIEELEKEDIRIFTDFEALLEAEKGTISLVIIPAGIDQHEILSVKAVEAGFDVLCEKPLTGTTASADRMIEAMKRSGGRIAVGYQHVYSPSIQRIKHLRCDGVLGALLRAKTKLLFPRNTLYYKRNAWAGRLFYQGVVIHDSILQNAGAHSLQNMLYIAGAGRHDSASPVVVEAEQYRAYPIESADTQFVRAGTDGGSEIKIWGSHAHKVRIEPLTEYEFENGKIVWEAVRNGKVSVFKKTSGRTFELMEEIENGPVPILDHMLKDVMETMRSDREPLCNPGNTRQHTALIETMFREYPIKTVTPSRIEKVPVEGHPEEYVYSVKGLDSMIEEAFRTEKSLAQAGAGRPVF